MKKKKFEKALEIDMRVKFTDTAIGALCSNVDILSGSPVDISDRVARTATMIADQCADAIYDRVPEGPSAANDPK